MLLNLPLSFKKWKWRITLHNYGIFLRPCLPKWQTARKSNATPAPRYCGLLKWNWLKEELVLKTVNYTNQPYNPSLSKSCYSSVAGPNVVKAIGQRKCATFSCLNGHSDWNRQRIRSYHANLNVSSFRIIVLGYLVPIKDERLPPKDQYVGLLSILAW